MKIAKLGSFIICLVLLLSVIGCRKPVSQRPDTNPIPSSQTTTSQNVDFPIQAGKYTILDISTDYNDLSRAKSNAEAAISKYPNMNCMVGLWAYNPPAILQAVEEAGKLDSISIVGFDENEVTLQAIEEGKVIGTIVQDPFAFGYKSVEFVSALVREQPVDVPENKLMFIPFKVIKKDNVASFKAEIDKINAGEGTKPEHAREDYDTSKKVKIAFLTNAVDPFWYLAEAGVRRAEPVFNATCEVYHPPNGTIEEQDRFVERIMADEVQGLAISPIDPANQTELINKTTTQMKVICHDSDAPESNREFYIGTGNYLAGRAAGKLVKEAIPDGGEVMIFVGKTEVLNAQERSQGLIDELMDKPIPPGLEQ